jgi:hypothetical protein
MMLIKDGNPLAPKIEGILDDYMDKTDKVDVSTIVGVKDIMSKLKLKNDFS